MASKSSITLLRGTLNFNGSKLSPNVNFVTTASFKNWIQEGRLWRELLRYQQANLITYNLDILPRPIMGALLLRLLSRGQCWLEDEQGTRQEVTPALLTQLLFRLINDYRKKPQFLKAVNQEIQQLQPKITITNLDLTNPPVYLRTDLCFGLKSGGSVGHIAGVLNNLDKFCGSPIFLTTDTIPTVRTDLDNYIIFPEKDNFWSLNEIPLVAFNQTFYRHADQILEKIIPSFIYQRYSLNNYCGVKLAKKFNIPFVLEYNGSEIWINRNWGTPLQYETLAADIETLNLTYADLVVVVSQPMKDELVTRKIDPEKILVNPNGVDPDRYSPHIDGQPIRKKYHLTDKLVIGFIGTFGKWHGAEVLAEAFGQLLQNYPNLRETLHLLMIGDGITMPQVKANLEKYQIQDYCTLTGIVPQAEGPNHLAACDILASPHVPNPDGTPFFGSPTKLFEYMAMGKGIVASDLDQIGEILDHDHTAWLVEPGNVTAFAEGLKILIDHPERRRRLGQASREIVVKHYTWQEHTRKIIDKLKERCGTNHEEN